MIVVVSMEPELILQDGTMRPEQQQANIRHFLSTINGYLKKVNGLNK